jgi:thiamine-phosphate pyrophosphorylase
LEQSSVDIDEVEPRLFLIGPETLSSRGVVDLLSAIFDESKPVAFLLRQGSCDDDGTKGQGTLRDIAAEKQVAFLVEDDLDLANRLGADGLHASNAGVVASVRHSLGAEKILGAEAALSRHDAMVAGDDGADYVAFGRRDTALDDEVIGLIAWWRDLFVLPCLAYARTPDEAGRAAAAGADFVGVSSAIWDCPDGAALGARHLLAAIEKK